MNRSRIAIAAIMLLLLAGVNHTASAAVSDIELSIKDNPLISISVKDANITDVFRLLAEQNNLNIVVSPNVHGNISLRLQDVTLEEALKVILDASNASVETTKNIIYVYSRQDSQRETSRQKEEMITEIFSLNYIDADQLVSILKDFLSTEGRIRTFSQSRIASNQTGAKPPVIILVDYPQNIETVRKLIEKLDIETQQIFIETKIVETSFNDLDQLGTDWNPSIGFSGSPIKMDSHYGSGGKINYGILDFSGFSAMWKRISQDKNTNVLSDARILTLDNETAKIHVGETIPVGVNTIGVNGNSGVNFGTTGVQQWSVGVNVNVTPHVLDNGVISMHIQPQISDVKSLTSIGNTSSAPVTTDRMIDTKILIRSGETIVLGGLVKESESKDTSKVPLLSQLPLVGGLFRSKNTNISKTNTMIFITATLMEPRGLKAPATSSVAAPVPPAKQPLTEFLEYK